MSSFFTLPASQNKRKRRQTDSGSAAQRTRDSKQKRTRDESISGSDESDDQLPLNNDNENDSALDDEIPIDEDPAAKRVRLAEQYLANTQKAVLEDVGFDAADVDAENLRRRMGDRLKEDTIEGKGKLYRWVAEELDWRGAEWSQFRHHQKSVTGVAVSGENAYTVGKDAVLVKWRLPQHEDKDTFGFHIRNRPKKVLASRTFGKQNDPTNINSHKGSILCVAASSDGRFVATGGADRKIIVWDGSTLNPLKTFTQHRDAVISLAFRRGTNQLFSASKDRTIKIWSLNELAYIETLFGHQDEVVDVGTLAQEQCITVGGRDRTARLWKVVEESQLVFRGGGAAGHSKKAFLTSDRIDTKEPFHEGSMDRVTCIDDETFITGSDNGSLSLWNIHKKKAVFTYPLAHGIDPPLPLEQLSAELDPNDAFIPKSPARWITALRAIPFSDVFVTGSWDGYVRVWKISSDKRRIEAIGPIGCVEDTVETLLDKEGLSSDSLSTGVLQAMKDGKEKKGRVHGCVNDLAIFDNGERMKNGVIVIAAVGKEHRLGRWTEIDRSKNYCVLFGVPKKQLNGTESLESNNEDTHDDQADGEGFTGFD